MLSDDDPFAVSWACPECLTPNVSQYDRTSGPECLTCGYECEDWSVIAEAASRWLDDALYTAISSYWYHCEE